MRVKYYKPDLFKQRVRRWQSALQQRCLKHTFIFSICLGMKTVFAQAHIVLLHGKQGQPSLPMNNPPTKRSQESHSEKKQNWNSSTDFLQERSYSWPQNTLGQGLGVLRLSRCSVSISDFCIFAYWLHCSQTSRPYICSRLYHIFENSCSEIKGDLKNPGEGFWLSQSSVTYCISQSSLEKQNN